MSASSKAGAAADCMNDSRHPFVMETVYSDGLRLWLSAATEEQARWNLQCAAQYTIACHVHERASGLVIAASRGASA